MILVFSFYCGLQQKEIQEKDLAYQTYQLLRLLTITRHRLTLGYPTRMYLFSFLRCSNKGQTHPTERWQYLRNAEHGSHGRDLCSCRAASDTASA